MSFTFINITMCSNIWSPHLTHFTNWGGKAEVHVRLPGFYVCVLVKVMTEEWTKYVCFLTWGATRYPGKIHSHVRICRTPGLRWSAHYWVLPQLKVNVHSGIHEVFKSTDVKVTFTHYKKIYTPQEVMSAVLQQMYFSNFPPVILCLLCSGRSNILCRSSWNNNIAAHYFTKPIFSPIYQRYFILWVY